MYGLDFSEVRYETDHAGNRLKATIPFPMFSALVEFWKEARRAQTASIERSARPGQFKGSLASVPSEPDTTALQIDLAPPAPVNRHDRSWSSLLAHLPATPSEPQQPEPEAQAVETSSREPKTRQVIFVREFVEPVPDEVAEQVRAGVYFLRAWRKYRGFTMLDVAELFGKHKDTINWHENGYSRPTTQTLVKFADIYDCTLAQLTAKAGSNTQPWQTIVESNPSQDEAKADIASPRAPDDTDYPDSVLAHMIGGKSPVTAWRLYRGLSIAELAERYGCTPHNIKQLEDSKTTLRQKTLDKLAAALHCKPVQLLKPESMPEHIVALKVSPRRARSAAVMARAARATKELARNA